MRHVEWIVLEGSNVGKKKIKKKKKDNPTRTFKSDYIIYSLYSIAIRYRKKKNQLGYAARLWLIIIPRNNPSLWVELFRAMMY